MVQAIQQEFVYSTSFLHTVFSLLPFHKSFHSVFSSYLKFLVTYQTIKPTEQLVERKCSCSYCLRKDSVVTSELIPPVLSPSLISVWKNNLRLLPIDSAQNTISQIIDGILAILPEERTEVNLVSILSQLLFECFHIIGRNKVLDVVELLWSARTHTPSIHLLSLILCHCTVLSPSDVLFIVCQIVSEAESSECVVKLILHVLLTHSTAWQQVQSDMNTLFTWLQSIPDTIWNEISPVIKWYIAVHYPSQSFCCVRWCVHLCQHCRSVQSISSHLQCPFCSPSECSGMQSNCTWKEGESNHCCPYCQMDCCAAIEEGTNPYTSCLCSGGRFPLTYNYDLFDSESSDNEFEDKRQCIEHLLQIKEQIIESRLWWNRMNLDVFLRVCQYLPYASLVTLATVNSDMQCIVDNQSIWKQRYWELFQQYRCTHPEGHSHDYKKLVIRRLKSIRRRKKHEIVCQYCGCCKRFSQDEDYSKHVIEIHVSLNFYYKHQ